MAFSISNKNEDHRLKRETAPNSVAKMPITPSKMAALALPQPVSCGFSEICCFAPTALEMANGPMKMPKQTKLAQPSQKACVASLQGDMSPSTTNSRPSSASTLQDAQLSRVPICIPKGTSSQDVVSKVVWYLREKADAEDLKLPAANLLGPVLAVLYNCTPGQPPKFTQP